MSKCGKCSKDFIASEFSVRCNDCKVAYHASCTSGGSSQYFTKQKLKTWRCDNCRGDSGSIKSNEDPDEKKSIFEAISEMKGEIVNKIDLVRNSVEMLDTKFEGLNEKVSQIVGEQAELRARCDALEQERGQLQAQVRTLQQQQRDADQHSRAANIEVVGLPYTPGEDVYHILGLISQVIGVTYKKEDVSIAHRLKLFSQKKHQHPPIIVQFVSRIIKETWIAAARKKKGLRSTDLSRALQPSSIFINDHLTAYNKALLGRARRLMKEKKLHFATYVNGKVIIKVKEGEDARRVTEVEDLDCFEEKQSS